MIKKYEQFLTKIQKSFDKSYPDFYNIKDYTISKETGRYNINTDVNIGYYGLIDIPFEIGIVKGYFDCHKNKITTLKNGPTIVSGSYYDCSDNLLTDLKFFPVSINGNVFIGGNYLTIEDYPYMTYISGKIYDNSAGAIMDFEDEYHMNKVLDVVKENHTMMLDYRIANNPVPFHQQIMRLNPDLIQYYTKIKPPSRKTFI